MMKAKNGEVAEVARNLIIMVRRKKTKDPKVFSYLSRQLLTFLEFCCYLFVKFQKQVLPLSRIGIIYNKYNIKKVFCIHLPC